MPASVRTRLAGSDDLAGLVELFDGYRQFYGQPSDRAGAAGFLAARLEKGDSVILLAELQGEAVGFAQLYPSFSSVGMAPVFILNDLFVSPDHRGLKVGKRLLQAAIAYGAEQGALRMTLSTEAGNGPARSMYENGGWVRDERFYVYNHNLKV